jgi:HD-GYP domain-containing protein (c-di-GMP phosphodiesterase class II)
MFFKNWWPFSHKKKQKQRQEEHPENNDLGSLEKFYTPVDKLELGMYITELDRPWLETAFKFQGFELKTEEEIRAVREICDYVYIDRTKKAARNAVTEQTKVNTHSVFDYGAPPAKLSAFEKEIVQTEKVYKNTKILVADFMEKIAMGGAIDTKLAKEAVADCVNNVMRCPDAMLWITQLKNKHEYTAQHSMNVCVLAIVLGRHLNLSETDLNVIGLCGMMHDMGKMLIPLELLNKPGKLEFEEMEVVKTHTTLGFELLKSSSNMHPSAIQAAYNHHERLDGKGYCRQISQSAISQFTRMVSIADMYDAMTSDRVYQKGRTHLETTNTMISVGGSHLDLALVVKFIESIGVYPPGCLVELTNGIVAIVIEVNEKTKLRPKIVTLLDEDKNHAPEQYIDLSNMIKDKRGNIYTIKGMIRAEDYNIDLAKYYQKIILQNDSAMKKNST